MDENLKLRIHDNLVAGPGARRWKPRHPKCLTRVP